MKALVVLSGGQDSTTALYWAKAHFDELQAVSFFYGQRHKAELEAAARIALDARVSHHQLDISALGHIGDSALVDASKTIQGSGGYVDREMAGGLPTSFVPGRNLLFLSFAAALAVRFGYKNLVTGVCQTDFSGYPDCRREFIDALEKTITLAMPSSAGPMQIHTPLMFLTKAETVHLARSFPGCYEALGKSITCYEGGRPGCGVCPACLLRVKGFAEAGFADPAFG